MPTRKPWAVEETFGPGRALGREMAGEVVLLARLRRALAELNPKLPPGAITADLGIKLN